jgi:hypothetical protein
MAEDKTGEEGSLEKSELEKKNREELLKVIDDLLKKEKERSAHQFDLNKASKEHLEILNRTAATLNDMTAFRETESQLVAKTLLDKAKGLDNEEQIRKEMSKAIEQMKQGKKISESMLVLKDAGMEITEEELANAAETLRINEQARLGQKKYGSDQKKIIGDMAKSIGLTDKYADTTLSKVYKGLEVVAQGGEEAEQYMAAMMDNVKETFNAKNLALNVFNAIKDNSIELFGAFDKAQASLAAATGQGDKFRGTLYEVGREGNLFGVSMDDAGKAIGTLVDQTSNFTSLSKATQSSLALNVAKMEKLGVATSDSAAIFQNFNQALGMTAKESMNMQTELAMAGVSIGVNAGKMTKDFNASLSTLMVYGRESVDVFKGIAAAAKAAGVETSTLLGIASKFDTFAGAAEGAGKLNALLGTQLSTTEMLMATEDERIRMLVESVQSQGVAFQDMDRFTQKAIANSVGITDMAEANRIFGMSLEAYDENERKLNASANAQKKLDDAVAKTVPVMDQFKKLGAELVVALEPFLETLESGAKALTDFFKSMSTEDKEMLASVVSIFSGLVLIWPVLKLAFAGFSLLGSAILPAVGLGSQAAATGMGLAGSAATGATAPVAAFATALGAVAIEVVLIVGVIALLAAAMAGMYYGMASIAEAISGIFSTIFTGITNVVSAIRGTNEETAQFEARAAEAMATIVSGNHEGALSSIKAMVEEVNKMGQDVKVSSTIENLALITAGKASSITGERVTASQTNVTANVQNFFEGMEMTLNVDGANFKAYVAKVANGEPT